MNPWWLLGAVAVVGLAYLQGRSDGMDACTAQAAREDKVAAVATEAAASAAAQAIARIRVTHTTVQQEVQREVRDNVVYRDCSHSPAGLRHLNAALTGRPEPAGGGDVPGADAADR